MFMVQFFLFLLSFFDLESLLLPSKPQLLIVGQDLSFMHPSYRRFFPMYVCIVAIKLL